MNNSSPARKPRSAEAPSSRRKFLQVGLVGGVAVGATALWDVDAAPHRHPAGETQEELFRIIRQYGGELGGRDIL